MNFQKYKSYSTSDFITDQDFIRWVLAPQNEDHLFWESFLLRFPQEKEVVELAREMVLALGQNFSPTTLTQTEKQEMLQKMKQNIQGIRKLKPRQAKLGIRFLKSRLFRIAAAAILLIGLGTWAGFNLINANQLIIQQTAFGEQQSIELPDGSVVKLNANSILKYPKKWDNRQERKVWLQGEAFFTVSKNLQSVQKFQVFTNDLTVEVLGTVFNVNSHQEDTKVFLEEGKVKLSLNGITEPLYMDPGELVVYDEANHIRPEKTQVNPVAHTSWKDGLLEFEQTPLTIVLEKLTEIYGINISVKDTSYYTLEITTHLPIENLEDALQILDLTMVDLEINKRANDYIIE